MASATILGDEMDDVLFGVPAWIYIIAFAIFFPLFFLRMAYVSLVKLHPALVRIRGSWADRSIVYIGTAIAILAMLFYTYAIVDIYYNDPSLNWTWSRAACAAAIVWSGLSFAIGFYWLRSARKDVYGVFEVGAGIATLSVTAYSMLSASHLTAFLGFIGGVYVIVRGLANFSDGRAELRIARGVE